MTNGEKYRGAVDRVNAFWWECGSAGTPHDAVLSFSEWLYLDAPAEANPLPCPFCGGECKVNYGTQYGEAYQVICLNDACGYDSTVRDTKDAAVAAHNCVARAVGLGLEKSQITVTEGC